MWRTLSAFWIGFIELNFSTVTQQLCSKIIIKKRHEKKRTKPDLKKNSHLCRQQDSEWANAENKLMLLLLHFLILALAVGRGRTRAGSWARAWTGAGCSSWGQRRGRLAHFGGVLAGLLWFWWWNATGGGAAAGTGAVVGLGWAAWAFGGAGHGAATRAGSWARGTLWTGTTPWPGKDEKEKELTSVEWAASVIEPLHLRRFKKKCQVLFLKVSEWHRNQKSIHCSPSSQLPAKVTQFSGGKCSTRVIYTGWYYLYDGVKWWWMEKVAPAESTSDNHHVFITNNGLKRRESAAIIWLLLERKSILIKLWMEAPLRHTHLFLAASISLIFLPLISFPDSFSRAFFRSL